MNNLEKLVADIGNTDLNAKTCEKVYMTAAKEFGLHAGEMVIIICAFLSGLELSGAA